ncbi:hypothetical protein [Leyella stercorea]|uniref:hypothetical protein n=1 Tax=Leyella stercorea TaxID=363265 RepID=UPI00242C6F10|nr:hypothetical protein [Leyella stercorea]
MKSILFFAACMALLGFTTTSCRFANSPTLGDTVAASVFEPADTALINKKTRAKVVDSTLVADSVGLYYIGSGSTREFIQLVSYPSRRDTTVYGKTRHIRVKGSAEINNVVRVKYYLLNGKDSLVKEVEQVKFS